MGNSYSVAQEEREEAEFERLVRAVERAERGESSVPHDLEAQYRYAEPQEEPPRSEKVVMWFKATHDNSAATPVELVEDPSPKHPVATPDAAEAIPNYVALEPNSVPPSILCQPQSPSPHTRSPSPTPQIPSPAVSAVPLVSLEPSCKSVPSSISADDSSSYQAPPWPYKPAKRDPEPVENDEGRDDDDDGDNDDKRNNPSVDAPSPVTLPPASLQTVPAPIEHPPSVVHVPHTVQAGPPLDIVPVLPSAITPDRYPSTVFEAPHTELCGRSRSRSPQRYHDRSSSRSRGPEWRSRNSLSDFGDLFYRPASQHEYPPSPDVSRGRSPARRQLRSQHTPPAPGTPSASEAQGRVSPGRLQSHSGSPSMYRCRQRFERPLPHVRSPSRQVNARSVSRSPDKEYVDYRNSLHSRQLRRQRAPDAVSWHHSPVQRSVQSQHNVSRAPSSQDIVDRRPFSRYSPRSRSRSLSLRTRSLRAHRPRTRSPSPLAVRQRSPASIKLISRSPSLRYVLPPTYGRRDPDYDDQWRRRRSQSPPLSIQSQHDVHREPSPERSNACSASPSYRPSRTPFREGRSLSPRKFDDRDISRAPRIPISVYERLGRKSSPVQRPVIIVPPPPHVPSRRLPATRSPSPSPKPDKFEQVLQLYEKTLLDHERRAELWQEHSKQLVAVVRRLEKHLVALRWHKQCSSADSLPLSLLDIDEKFAEEKNGAGVHLQSLAYTSPGPVQAKPYPSRPYAAGLPVRRCSDDWQPKWDVFPLKAFRGSSYTYLKIHAGWDDAALLRELGRSYDKLRTVWRKWFSLRSVRSISMVYADHTCVYPRRIGPAGVSPSKNMRLRYFLKHPEQMKDRHEFMQVLTARTDLGIEFVEGWQLTRIAVAILLPVFASLVLAVLYSALYGDVSGAFTIAGYMTSAYSVCLVLLGLLNFVEF